MNDCPSISCIIPAYNAEAYIDDCLTSIVNQEFSYGEIEIIVINDGSTDATEEKVRSFQKHHHNIKLINQSNSRQGAARNQGIKAARGEYICFLDSDDYYFYSNAVEKMYETCREHNLCYFLSNCYTSIGTDSHPDSQRKGYICNLQIHSKDSLMQTNELSFCVWLGLYERKVLLSQNCYFREHVFMEDLDWYVKSILVLDNQQRVGIGSFPFVAYRQTPTSTTRAGNIERFHDNIVALNALYELLTSANGVSFTAKKTRIEALARNVIRLPRAARIHRTVDSLECFSKMRRLSLESPMLKDLGFVEKSKLRILQACPALLFTLYRTAYLIKRSLSK